MNIKIFLYLDDLIRGTGVYNNYKQLQRCIHLSSNELDNLQNTKLKNILIHSYNHTNYYKELFNSIGFNPNEFKSKNELTLIPLLTRQIIQENIQGIISDKHHVKKLHKGTSSGSTGIPVMYFKDKLAIGAGQAAGYVGWSLAGWRFGMKGLHIWGNPTTVNNEWKRLSSRIKAELFRHHKFAAYKLNEPSHFYNLLNILNKGYDFIDGYTNAIYFFSLFLKENNLTLANRPKYVFTTAENLHVYQKILIEEMVGPVFDGYGCSEINGIAYQCGNCDNYHIMDPHVIVEYGDVVDENGSRNIIVTDLDNYAFPFIRYKNDDLVKPLNSNEATCTLNLKSFKSVVGRESDMLRFNDGGVLSVPSFFGSMLLKKINGLKQYQVEKINKDLIYVNLVKSESFTNEELVLIHKSLDDYLAGKIKYKINFVESITLSPSGKHKLLIDRTI